MEAPDRVTMRVPVAGRGASLCDALDSLLDTGVVVSGELTVSLAGVDLLYVGVEIVAGSYDATIGPRAARRRVAAEPEAGGA